MTFVASVVAKDGIALIADSLVTSSTSTLHIEDFIEHLQNRDPDSGDLTIPEITPLFKRRPLYTKDYEKKLMQFGRSSAILTSGGAEINGQRIFDLNESFKKWKGKPKGFANRKFKSRVDVFAKYLEDNVRKHIESNGHISRTTLIFSYWRKLNKTSEVYKVEVHSCKDKEILGDKEFTPVTVSDEISNQQIVASGQARITSNILYGGLPYVSEMIPLMMKKVEEDFNLKEVSDNYQQSIMQLAIEHSKKLDSLKIVKLKDLSLQQAVDLADLLMKIEMRIQEFTENIATVGGVIKRAYLSEKGFTWLSGDEIESPS